MTTAKINIKFLQQPLNNQNFNYVVEENSIPIQTINKTFKAPITQNSSRIAKINGTDMTVISTFNVGTGINSIGGLNRLASVTQPDGKHVIVGNFSTYNGVSVSKIVRVNANGSLDTTFNTGIGFNGYCHDIAIQSDGKLIIVGFFTSYNGVSVPRIVRLNTNGTIDSTFNVGTGFNLEAERIYVQPDGKILVSGQFTSFAGVSRNHLVRLLNTGAYDSTFSIGTGFKLGGSTSLSMSAIKLQPDGKILVGGFFDEYNGTPSNKITRLNTNGSIDSSFIVGTGVGGAGTVTDIEVLSTDKILVSGRISTYNEIPTNQIIRLNTNGTLDLTFNTGTGLGTNQYPTNIIVLTNGDIICAGNMTSYNGNNRNFIVKLDEDGTYIPDSLTFNAATVHLNKINDSEIIVLGDFISTTSPAVQTATDIPIGLTVNDTINYTQINLNTFNAQSGVTYTISGDTVLHQVDYDSTVNLLALNNVNDIPSYVIITFEDGIITLIGDIVIADDTSPLNPINIVNPAYNNTILRWSSNLTNTAYSELIVNGKTYRVYPMNNSFIYNFKDIAKNLINENYFKDVIIPDLFVTDIYDDSTLSLELPVTINLWNTLGQFLTKNITLKFIKSVEQLPNYANKLVNAPAVRMLLPTNNYTDYYLPYFEGYPCDFAVYGITSNDTYYLKNISNYNQSDTLTGTTNEVKRFFLSDGFSDGTISDDLNLASTQNKVELWVNDSFVSNLIIDKKESKCGVYLRWFNNSGSYSYWLFDEPYQQSTQYRMIDDIQGAYDNLQSISSTSEIIGKTGNRTLKLKTKFNLNQKEYLESLLSSAKVEMYAYNKPFSSPINENSFFGIKVNDGSFSFNIKNSNNTLELTITMPEINTQTL